MDKENDRRSLKTRAALLAAFRDLLLEKGYDALQVGDICVRADVGRSTFYEHYPSKAELLRASLATPFTHMAGIVLPGAVPAQIVPWLQHFRQHQQMVRVLLGWPTRPLLSQALTALIAARLPLEGTSACPRDTVARLVADAQLALLDIWILARPASHVDDLADALLRSSAALVAAFGMTAAPAH